MAEVKDKSVSHAAADPAAPVAVPLPGEKLPRPLFVWLALILALGVTVLCAGAIALRWYEVRFPNAVIVNHGDASTEGVEIVVQTEDGHEIARETLSEKDSYEFVVLVKQGIYRVHASLRDRTFSERRFFVADATAVTIPIEVPPELNAAVPPPASRPAVPPARTP